MSFPVVLAVLGLVLSVWATILMIVRSFRAGIAWGLVVFFVPLGVVAFVIARWAEAKKPLLLQLLGTGLCVTGILMQPGITDGIRARLKAPGQVAANPEDPAVPLTREIDALREENVGLQGRIAAETPQVAALYKALNEKRAALKPGDRQAVEAFNQEAAKYVERNNALAAMQQKLAANHARISKSLDEPSLADVPAKPQVVVYSTSWCGACKSAKKYLAAKNIPYQEIDVEKSQEGAAEFRKRGGRGVPLIVIGEKQMSGFSSQWIDEQLKL